MVPGCCTPLSRRHRLLVKPSLLLRLLSPPSRSPSLCHCSESLGKGDRDGEGCLKLGKQSERNLRENQNYFFYIILATTRRPTDSPLAVLLSSVHIARISSSDLQDGKQQSA